jgi:hypothetical protein
MSNRIRSCDRTLEVEGPLLFFPDQQVGHVLSNALIRQDAIAGINSAELDAQMIDRT